MLKHVIPVLALCCLSATAAELWKADFSKDGDFSWKQTAKCPADKFQIVKGELVGQFTSAPYKGSAYETELPDTESGSLVFEYCLDSTKTKKFSGLSLQIRFLDSITAFLSSGWYRYRNQAEVKSKMFSHAVKPGEWHTFKIAFDKKAGTIQYFIDDMGKPAFTDEKVNFPAKMTLRIANYGLNKTTIENRIRNLRLEPAAEK